MDLISRREYEDFVKTIPKDHCPICHQEEQIILCESENWIWIANISPYWKYHTMLVPKRHIEYLSDLHASELFDFQLFLKKIIKHLLKSGLTYDDNTAVNQFLVMFRESADDTDTSYYKMDHLHVHVVPEKRGVDRFKLDPAATQVDIHKLKMR